HLDIDQVLTTTGLFVTSSEGSLALISSNRT
ncbi:MAG: hypothetical protein ACJA2S_002332, partial [Cyclobacteriaceae bacterium]